MLRYLKDKWIYFTLIITLMIAEPAIGSYLILLLNGFYSSVEVGTAKVLILRMLLTGILIWVGKRLVSFAGGLLRRGLICHVRKDIKSDIFSSLLQRPRAEQQSGQYVSALTNDITLLEQHFFEQLLSLLGNVFSIVILSSSFMTLDKTLGSAVLLFGLSVSAVPALFQKKMAEKSRDFSLALGGFTGRVGEIVCAFPTIKNFGAEGVARRRFEEYNGEAERRSFDAAFALSLGNNVASTLSWFMQIICIGTGLILVSRGQIVMATLISSLAFTEDLAMPLGGIVSNINSLLSVRGITRRIAALCAGEREQTDAPAPLSGDIEYQGLSVRAGGRYILKDFTYTFKKGKKYLILGPNGSGKSSIFKALKKQFESFEGSIRVGGKEVRETASGALSRGVSYFGEPVLFSGTVRENVSMFRSFGDREYERAIKRARLCLPADLVIGERGKTLSGGERQRVELARSLLSGAGALVLDESMANLDLQTAYTLEQEILDYEETVIHISHHPFGALLAQYDDILIMENGRLVDHGKARDLKHPYFKELCNIAIGNKA